MSNAIISKLLKLESSKYPVLRFEQQIESYKKLVLTDDVDILVICQPHLESQIRRVMGEHNLTGDFETRPDAPTILDGGRSADSMDTGKWDILQLIGPHEQSQRFHVCLPARGTPCSFPQYSDNPVGSSRNITASILPWINEPYVLRPE